MNILKNEVLPRWLVAVILKASQIVNNPIISSDHMHSWFSVDSNQCNALSVLIHKFAFTFTIQWFTFTKSTNILHLCLSHLYNYNTLPRDMSGNWNIKVKVITDSSRCPLCFIGQTSNMAFVQTTLTRRWRECAWFPETWQLRGEWYRCRSDYRSDPKPTPNNCLVCKGKNLMNINRLWCADLVTAMTSWPLTSWTQHG